MKDGNISYEYTYDNHQNWTTQKAYVYYNEEPNVRQWTEREYTYANTLEDLANISTERTNRRTKATTVSTTSTTSIKDVEKRHSKHWCKRSNKSRKRCLVYPFRAIIK